MSSPVAELFTRALGLEDPWQVVKLEFSESDKRLDIHLDFPRGSRFRCPVCGREDAAAYDTEEKDWRRLNFFQHQAYLHCRVPRINCPDNRARGFSSIKYFIAMIYMIAGKLNFNLPT